MKEQKHYFLEKQDYRLSPATENEEKIEKFHNQHLIWGFDERELWNLDRTMLLLLYERLLAFSNLATDKVDLTYTKHDIQIMIGDDPVNLNLEQSIQFMLGTIEKTMQAWDDLELVKAFELSKLVWLCWSQVNGEMWY